MNEFQEATNFQYIDEKELKKVFISYANSYHAKEIVKKLLEINENGKTFYEIFATFQENRPELENVQKLSSKCGDFPFLVTECDIVVCDISQDKNQLEETKMILNFLDEKLKIENEVKLTLILISSIMTWAKTPNNADEVTTDRHYRKRRPHPCFNQHLLIERRILSLQRKFSNKINSFVVCGGIIYGEEEDIFHYLFKQCYFNFPQVDIFLPGSNKLPLIYIHDFARFIVHVITNPPENQYLLAVQPEPLNAIKIVRKFVEELGGEEMRIKICEKEQIFLMNEDTMTQRVFDHLTLNLDIQSELANFEFEITGSNFEENILKIAQEYYNSRKLKPIKILIDGSPFAYQNELAKMLCNYYHLHHVKNKCFLKNFMTRLKKKIEDATNYMAQMSDISSKLDDGPMLMQKTQNGIKNWKEKIEKIQKIIDENEEVSFDDKKDFIKERLSSHACLKHQGYVMSGFELDRKRASSIFLDESEDLNELKPDFVIILNRTMDIDPECLEIEGYDENETDKKKIKEWKLKFHYDSQFEDISLLSFFTDLNVMPLEFLITHDLSHLELGEIFDSIVAKIGEPCTYELSDKEKLEIEKLKNEIAEKEKLERDEEEKIRIQEEKEEKEKLIEEWTKQAIEHKKKELEEIERHSIPVRNYLMKHVLPKISTSLIELAKVRPSNPTQFLVYHLHQQNSMTLDEELDEEIVKEFQRLVSASKWD